MKTIIAATARSGTKYTAEVLRSQGLLAGHEKVFGRKNFRNIDTKANCFPIDLDIDVSWLSVPYLEHAQDYAFIAHQVRHPLKTISSLLGMHFFIKNGFFTKFAHRHMTCSVEGLSIPEMCVSYWIDWNKQIEPYAKVRFRVEDFTRDPWPIMTQLGLTPHYTTEEVSTTINRRKRGPQLSVRDLPRHRKGELIDLARKYGYKL